MNKIRITICILLSFWTIKSSAQDLSLTDLQNICQKTNWEYVNQYLIKKGWEYFESEKGGSNRYNTITWSYSKNYEDKAIGWFYLYTYEGLPNKISYDVFNQPAYNQIQNALTANGYKLQDNEIKDNEISTKYSSDVYLLKITTKKRNNENKFSYSSESLTVYNFELIKKNGIYDADNGEKVEYFINSDQVQFKYTLKNGKINGLHTRYYYRGNIEIYPSGIMETRNYVDGIENGKFTSYSIDGRVLEERFMKNGKEHGMSTEYHYTPRKSLEEPLNTKVYKKEFGNYIDGEKDGIWKTILVKDGSEKNVLEFFNYSNGVLDGAFQLVQGDSLIIGTYKDDRFHGDIKIYQDINIVFSEDSIIETDISKLKLITKGQCSNGVAYGQFKFYYFDGMIQKEGEFLNNKFSGEWKYYRKTYKDNKGKPLPFSNELFLISTYSNGMKNGKQTRFSYLNESQNKNSSGDYKSFSYQKVTETSVYKNDKLDGPFEVRDSIGTLLAKGNYSNDLKQDNWFRRYSNIEVQGNLCDILEKANYLDDQLEGQLIQYYQDGNMYRTFNYKNGKIHGEYILWNKLNNPSKKKIFENGELKELIIFDSKGISPVSKYEIQDVQSTSYKCRKTKYINNGYISQVYWLKKESEIDNTWDELTFESATNANEKMGYEDGTFNHYINEQPIETGEKYKGNKVGWWNLYDYDQKVKLEQKYTLGKVTNEVYKTLDGKYFSGKFTYINVNQNIKEIRSIRDAFRNGKTVFYDLITGKKIRTETYKNGILK